MDYDVLIIGCGASGIQAAVHAARKKVKVGVVGKPYASALVKAHIENYFGIEKTDGTSLINVGLSQARRFGADIVEEEVISLEMVDGAFKVKTDGMKEFSSKALIIASGISRTKLNVEGEKEFYGLGVSYCANCDCHFFKKKKVAVVGNGSNAAVAALLLKEYAEKVYWVSQEITASKELIEKVDSTSIEKVTPAWPSKIVGEKTVSGMHLKDGRYLEVDGVFIELGAKGAADLAVEIGIVADETGSIPVDRDCRTEVEGVFACGDVTGQPWQLAKAVGEGCVAGLSAAAFVRKEKE
ncbi:MAG: FAD-dependent oxidoreductase [Methanomassiliicoccales archaeon]|nr:MAG: FAD-dependent oxidoreductase [Methanomassiliicoccales archaeon]